MQALSLLRCYSSISQHWLNLRLITGDQLSQKASGWADEKASNAGSDVFLSSLPVANLAKKRLGGRMKISAHLSSVRKKRRGWWRWTAGEKFELITGLLSFVIDSGLLPALSPSWLLRFLCS